MSIIEEKLGKIEKEIFELKKILITYETSKTKVSLKGILKGLKFEEEDFLGAKKSLFKYGA
jgi:hypothetical protein